MIEDRKVAYRHLGLTGYTSIAKLLSQPKVKLLNFSYADINQNITAAIKVSNWFEKLMEANVNDFVDFDEKLFWSQLEKLNDEFPDYGVSVYKAVFEDSLQHVSKTS